MSRGYRSGGIPERGLVLLTALDNSVLSTAHRFPTYLCGGAEEKAPEQRHWVSYGKERLQHMNLPICGLPFWFVSEENFTKILGELF